MGGGWPAQRRIDDLDDIGAWVAKRNANVALRQQAEVIGRDLWDQATRDGQDVSAAQPSDVVAIGTDALAQKQPAGSPDSEDPSSSRDSEYGLSPQQPGSDVAAVPLPDPGPIVTTMPGYRFATARSGDSISRLLGASDPGAVGRFLTLNGMDGRNSTLQIGHSYAVPTRFDDATQDEIAAGKHLLRSDNTRLAAAHVRAANDPEANLFAQRLNSGLNVWTGEAPDYGAPPSTTAPSEEQPWWDRNQFTKALAGEVGLQAGRGLGALRGGVHIAGDAIGGVGFLTRLAAPQPLDQMLSPPGMSARQQVAKSVSEKLQYLDRVRANPDVALSDLKDFGRRAVIDLIPEASPEADTAFGEFGRNLRIGANQGEVGANLAMLPVGGEAFEGISTSRLAGAEARAGLLPKLYPQATDYFAKLYDATGHHYFSQRGGKFANVGGVPLPAPLTALPLPTFLRDSEIFRGAHTGRIWWRRLERKEGRLAETQSCSPDVAWRIASAEGGARSRCARRSGGQQLSGRLERALNVRPWAVFLLAPSDDKGPEGRSRVIEDREVGQAIPDIFVRLGAEVFVADAQEDRWTFHLVYKEQHFLCRLVSLCPMFVLRLYNLRGGRFSLKKPAIYAELAERFSSELTQNARFGDVLWYSDQQGGPPVEPNGSGTASPLAPRTRSIADLTWGVQSVLFLLGCGGLIDSAIKFVSGEFGIALSTLIGSAIFLFAARDVVKAVWQRLSSRAAAAKAEKGAAPP